MPIGPIDYSSLGTQLDVSPLLQGLQLRNQAADGKVATAQRQQAVQLAQAKFTQQQTEDAAYRTALADYTANPTALGLVSLSARFPDHQAALEAGFKTYTAAQQQDLLGAVSSSLGALANGRPDLAAHTVQSRRDALARSGIDTTQTDAVLDLLKKAQDGDQDASKRAKAMLGVVLSGAVGADHASGILTQLGIGADAERKAADSARDDARFDEQRRHNRAEEGTAAANAATSRGQLGVAQTRERREGAKAASAGKGGKLPNGFILD